MPPSCGTDSAENGMPITSATNMTIRSNIFLKNFCFQITYLDQVSSESPEIGATLSVST